MGALVLKSKNSLNVDVEPLDFTLYKQRVVADGGAIIDEQATKDAINFGLSNGVNNTTGFSVTSPRWGAKISNGNVVKLYSLFNSAGDVVTSGNAKVDSSRGYNAYTLYGSSVLYLKTVGSFSKAKSVLIACVNSIPVREIYGLTPSYILGSTKSETPNRDTVYKGDTGAALGYLGDSGTAQPETWSLRGIASDSVDLRLPDMAYAPAPISVAVLEQSNLLSLYRDGIKVGDTASVMLSGDNMHYYIGVGPTAFPDYDVSNPAMTDVIESWCVINVDSTTAEAVTARMSTVY